MNLTEAERYDIQRVISGQLEALSSGDGARGLSFATPTRQRYGSGERFLEVVQATFPQLMGPGTRKFGALRLVRGHWTQQVTLTTGEGAQVPLLYVMERQVDLSWRIDGCILLDRKGADGARPPLPN